MRLCGRGIAIVVGCSWFTAQARLTIGFCSSAPKVPVKASTSLSTACGAPMFDCSRADCQTRQHAGRRRPTPRCRAIGCRALPSGDFSTDRTITEYAAERPGTPHLAPPNSDRCRRTWRIVRDSSRPVSSGLQALRNRLPKVWRERGSGSRPRRSETRNGSSGLAERRRRSSFHPARSASLPLSHLSGEVRGRLPFVVHSTPRQRFSSARTASAADLWVVDSCLATSAAIASSSMSPLASWKVCSVTARP